MQISPPQLLPPSSVARSIHRPAPASEALAALSHRPADLPADFAAAICHEIAEEGRVQGQEQHSRVPEEGGDRGARGGGRGARARPASAAASPPAQAPPTSLRSSTPTAAAPPRSPTPTAAAPPRRPPQRAPPPRRSPRRHRFLVPEATPAAAPLSLTSAGRATRVFPGGGILLLPLPSVRHLPLPPAAAVARHLLLSLQPARSSPNGPVAAVGDCICCCCRRLPLLLLLAAGTS